MASKTSQFDDLAAKYQTELPANAARDIEHPPLPDDARREINDPKLSDTQRAAVRVKWEETRPKWEPKERDRQAEFWGNWAAVGDAKLKLAALADDIVKADQDWRDCRAQAGMIGRAGLECGCGKHAKIVEHLLTERNKAKAVVDREIVKFKKG